MMRTGRYRFRPAWLGYHVLQAEFLDEHDSLLWRDVDNRDLHQSRVFCVIRPSQWLAFVASDDHRKRVERAQRKTKPRKPEFEASRLL